MIVFRFFVKLKSFGRLHADDYLAVTAWTMLFAVVMICQTQTPTLYEQYDVVSGRKPSTPAFVDRYTTFVRSILPLSILFYSCLWCIKLSLLLFFRRLLAKVRGQHIWWWIILVVTLITWVACIADIQYRCYVSSIDSIIAYCSTLPAIKSVNRNFYADCSLDVITDCLSKALVPSAWYETDHSSHLDSSPNALECPGSTEAESNLNGSVFSNTRCDDYRYHSSRHRECGDT